MPVHIGGLRRGAFGARFVTKFALTRKSKHITGSRTKNLQANINKFKNMIENCASCRNYSAKPIFGKLGWQVLRVRCWQGGWARGGLGEEALSNTAYLSLSSLSRSLSLPPILLDPMPWHVCMHVPRQGSPNLIHFGRQCTPKQNNDQACWWVGTQLGSQSVNARPRTCLKSQVGPSHHIYIISRGRVLKNPNENQDMFYQVRRVSQKWNPASFYKC